VRLALLGAAGQSGPQVLVTTASTGEGVPALVDALDALAAA
jgi:hypothetical protein